MFNGRSNDTKIKVLLILHHERYERLNCKGLTTREIARQTGTSLAYIQNRLPKWRRWRYVGRVIVENNGRAEIHHTIRERGRLYLEDVCSFRCPEKLLRCVEEVKVCRGSLGIE